MREKTFVKHLVAIAVIVCLFGASLLLVNNAVVKASSADGYTVYEQNFDSATVGGTYNMGAEGYFSGTPTIVEDSDLGKSAKYEGTGVLVISLSDLYVGNTYRISMKAKIENTSAIVIDYVDGANTYSTINVTVADGTCVIGNSGRFLDANYNATTYDLDFVVTPTQGDGRNSIIFYYDGGTGNATVDDIQINNIDASIDFNNDSVGVIDLYSQHGSVFYNNSVDLSQSIEITDSKELKITSTASIESESYPSLQISSPCFSTGRDYEISFFAQSDAIEWYIDVENCGTAKASFSVVGKDDGDETQNGVTLNKSGDIYSLSFNYSQEASADMVVKLISKLPANAGDKYLLVDDICIKVVPINKSIELDISNAKTEYEIDDTLDTSGMQVSLVKSDYSQEIISDSDYTVSGFDSSTAGEKTLTVTHSSSGFTKTYNVTVVVSVESFDVSIIDADKLQFEFGTLFDATVVSEAISVQAIYSDDPSNPVGLTFGEQDDNYQIYAKDFNPYRASDYQVEISWMGLQESITVVVNERAGTSSSIKLNENFNEMTLGETSLSGYLLGQANVVTSGEGKAIQFTCEETDGSDIFQFVGFENFIEDTAYTFSMTVDTTCTELHFDYLVGGTEWYCFGIKNDESGIYEVGGGASGDILRNAYWNSETKILTFTIFFDGVGEATDTFNRIKVFAKSAGAVTIDNLVISQSIYLYNEEFDSLSSDGYIGSLPLTLRTWDDLTPTGSYVEIDNGYAYQIQATTDSSGYNKIMYLQREKASAFAIDTEYEVEVGISQDGLQKLFLEFEQPDGDSVTSTIEINFASNSANTYGSGGEFYDVSYSNGVLKFKLSASVVPQIKFTVLGDVSSLVTLNLEYVRIKEEVMPYTMSLDTTNVKTGYTLGTDTALDTDDLKVIVRYTDESIVELVSGYSFNTIDFSVAGTKEVVVTYVENGTSLSASYDINVDLQVVSIEVDTSGVDLLIRESETLSLNGLVVNIYYTDGSTFVATEYTSEIEKGTDKYTVTISYYDSIAQQTHQDSYEVTILTDKEIILDTENVKVEYAYGEEINLDGLVVYVVLSNDEQIGLSASDYTINYGGYDEYKSATYTIKISYGNLTASFEVEVLAETVAQNPLTLDTSNVKVEYAYGESINLENLIVQFENDDQDKQTLSDSEYTIDLGGYDANTSGNYTITVSYGDYKATFTVTVLEKTGCSANILDDTLFVGLMILLCSVMLIVKSKKKGESIR